MDVSTVSEIQIQTWLHLKTKIQIQLMTETHIQIQLQLQNQIRIQGELRAINKRLKDHKQMNCGCRQV